MFMLVSVLASFAYALEEIPTENYLDNQPLDRVFRRQKKIAKEMDLYHKSHRSWMDNIIDTYMPMEVFKLR